MSERPTEILEWATVDLVDPITGVNNVVEPPQSLKNTGYAPAYIKPTRQYENWFKRATSKWIKYLDQKAGSNLMELQTSWWGQVYIDSSYVKSIAKNKTSSFFVIGGVYSEDGIIFTSSDTLKWDKKTKPLGTYDIVNTVINNPLNDNFLAGGNNGKLSISTDNGNTWVAKNSQFGTDAIRGIFYNNGVFVAGGNNGKLSISTDNGNTWVAKNSQFGTTNINAVYCYYNKWLAIGDSGKWSISTDNGNTWVEKTIFTDLHLACIISKDNYILMGTSSYSSYPVVFSSKDSENWVLRSIITSHGSSYIPSFVIYGKNSFILGNGSYIFLSVQLSE